MTDTQFNPTNQNQEKTAPQPETSGANNSSTNEDQVNDPFEHLPKPIPERTLLSWQAPSRVFKKRNRQYFATVLVIGLLISLILVFAGQFLPIAVVLSVVFLVYVLSTVPPNQVSHKITNYGIWVEKNLYYWDELGRFWYIDKFGQKILHVETVRFPGRLSMLLGTANEQEITDLLSQVLIKQKPAATFFDRAADWMEKNIPLEN